VLLIFLNHHYVVARGLLFFSAVNLLAFMYRSFDPMLAWPDSGPPPSDRR
jgi:hypothetical protein